MLLDEVSESVSENIPKLLNQVEEISKEKVFASAKCTNTTLKSTSAIISLTGGTWLCVAEARKHNSSPTSIAISFDPPYIEVSEMTWYKNTGYSLYDSNSAQINTSRYSDLRVGSILHFSSSVYAESIVIRPGFYKIKALGSYAGSIYAAAADYSDTNIDKYLEETSMECDYLCKETTTADVNSLQTSLIISREADFRVRLHAAFKTELTNEVTVSAIKLK